MDATQCLVTRQVVTLSGRRQISGESYRVDCTEEGRTSFEVKLANIAAIDQAVGGPKDEVLLVFREASSYGIPVEHRVPLKTVVRNEGRIVGVIEAFKNPSTILCEVFLRAEDSPRWKAKGDLGRPDLADLKSPGEGGDQTRGNLRPAAAEPKPAALAPTGSLIHMAWPDDIGGFFDVLLSTESDEPLPMPRLVLNREITRERLERNTTLQALIFPEVVRRVVTAMAMHPEEYNDAPWFKPWAKYAASLVPGEEGFGYFRGSVGEDESVDPETVHQKVRVAVKSYIAQMKLALLAERISTDEV